MRLILKLLLALQFSLFALAAAAQGVIVKIELGDVEVPLKVRTSEGTYTVSSDRTYYRNLTVYSATDAYGRDVPMSSSTSNRTGQATVRTYRFSGAYGNAPSGNDYSESYDYTPRSRERSERRYPPLPPPVDIDGYPNVQLALGLSRAYGEYARVKLCLGGDRGFILYGGTGKDWVFNGKNKDKLSWHVGVGYYTAFEYSGHELTSGFSYAETPVTKGGALNFDMGYTHFFGDREVFGLFGGLGLGVGNLKDYFKSIGEMEGAKLKFVWDIQIGIAFKLWQKH